MDQQLALRVLDEIMHWDEPRRQHEFEWLQLMSRFKYDDYRDFGAGMRFLERLADWLQQFESSERETAYQFVKDRLIYFGRDEIAHLVELFYYRNVQPQLQLEVAAQLGIRPYLVWSRPESIDLYARTLRQCLFFGLSDGARIDSFRRVNTPEIKNDQILLATEISDEKWADVLDSLRKDLGDKHARFKFAFLLDDFIGTGSTLIRLDKGKWKGRLVRFWLALPEGDKQRTSGDEIASGGVPADDTVFEPNFVIQVHHYISTAEAQQKVLHREKDIRTGRGKDWFPSVAFTFGTILPGDIKITPENATDLRPLIEKHYNGRLENDSTRVGGTDDIKFGYGYCGLPLVLEHNTPNNSLPLIWADLPDGIPEMRPLFRRRQRHSS